MALVSNFTIGTSPGPRKTSYQLQITNLEDVSIEYLFEAHFMPGDDPVAIDSLSVHVDHFSQWTTPFPP